jgi:hypothetical protein
MKKAGILILGLFFCVFLIWSVSAANIYVDKNLTSDCTTGNYNKITRTCFGSDGNAYNTVQEVIYGTDGTNPKANVGDKIYLRNGTYSESYGTTSTPGAADMQISIRLDGNSWNEGHYILISSYPNEWAIINGSRNRTFAIGYGTASKGEGMDNVDSLNYIKFERLEITNGAAAGLAMIGNNIWVRYCYFHNNGIGPGGDSNKAGLQLFVPQHCIIEYNYFSGNGYYDPRDNGCELMLYADYAADERNGLYNISTAQHSNEIRYNYFYSVGPNTPPNTIHDKATQRLCSYGLGSHPYSEIDNGYRDQGNKYNHNIIRGDYGEGIYSSQDYEQIYNNIVDLNSGAPFGISTEDSGLCLETYKNTFYNNYIFKGTIDVTSGYDVDYTAPLKLDFIALNNILDTTNNSDTSPAIGISTKQCFRVGCSLSARYNWTDTDVDRNLIYKPLSSSQHIGLPYSYLSKGTRWINVTTFNSQYGFSNYLSYNNGLFLGTTGSAKYKTNSSFSLGNEKTIANGGVNISHPYLSGVKIPAYVGAVNPNDNAWVDGVLSLADTNVLKNSNEGDPVWIEGSGSQPPTQICEATSPGKCYYVSPSGTGNCNFTNPCKIKNALALMKGGDYLYLLNGTYSEFYMDDPDWGVNATIPLGKYFGFQNPAPNKTNPLTIKSYPGQHPIIRGDYTKPCVWVDKKSGIIFDGLDIQQCWEAGIFLKWDEPVSDIIVKNCNFSEIVCHDNMGGVFINSAKNVLIDNNTFSSMYYEGQKYALSTSDCNGSAMVLFGATNVTISNNEFFNTCSGLYYKHGEVGTGETGGYTRIINNSFHDLNSRSFCIGINQNRAEIRNNIINCYRGIMLYDEDGTVGPFLLNVTIDHNTIITNGIGLNRGSDTSNFLGAINTKVTNNIFYNSTYNIWTYGSDAQYNHGVGLVSNNNCYYNSSGNISIDYFGSDNPAYGGANTGGVYTLTQWKTQGFDLNSTEANPMFINFAAGNYNLQNNSLCKGMGATFYYSENQTQPPVAPNVTTMQKLLNSFGSFKSGGSLSDYIIKIKEFILG